MPDKIRIYGNFKLETDGGSAEYGLDSDDDPEQKDNPSIDWLEWHIDNIRAMFKEGLNR